jgi:high affinity Mn2+ porin
MVAALPPLALAALIAVAPGAALADETPAAAQNFALHAQATFVDQANFAFDAPYSGPNSLPPKAEGRETADVTLFLGARLWPGAEAWANPEVDQGFGLHDTLGVAGFPSGEAYKVGKSSPYVRLQRLYLRQTIDLGGGTSKVETDLNQFSGERTADRLVITIGKFSVTDVFDTNDYAHDPKRDFLNWALIDAGTFDYAADAWGYTLGASAEWYAGDWTVRGGLFDLSVVPNSETLDDRFSQFQMLGEIERRYELKGRDGSIKLTAFVSRGRMGLYEDAIALGVRLGEPPSTALVRRYRTRDGISLDGQQELSGTIGVFARAGWAGGEVEPYEFSDIDRTLSAGLSLKGKAWGRASDTLAVAGVANQISAAHQAYFAAGGLGILVGDGRLPHPGAEHILESYYDFAVSKGVHVSLDYQFVENPAYNTDRGPVSIIAARLHAQF